MGGPRTIHSLDHVLFTSYDSKVHQDVASLCNFQDLSN